MTLEHIIYWRINEIQVPGACFPLYVMHVYVFIMQVAT